VTGKKTRRNLGKPKRSNSKSCYSDNWPTKGRHIAQTHRRDRVFHLEPAARAQQGGRVRRIGVLMPYGENDHEVKLRYSAFTQALADWLDRWPQRADRPSLGGH
jgi:hypothetical protein